MKNYKQLDCSNFQKVLGVSQFRMHQVIKFFLYFFRWAKQGGSGTDSETEGDDGTGGGAATNNINNYTAASRAAAQQQQLQAKKSSCHKGLYNS